MSFFILIPQAPQLAENGLIYGGVQIEIVLHNRPCAYLGAASNKSPPPPKKKFQ